MVVKAALLVVNDDEERLLCQSGPWLTAWKTFNTSSCPAVMSAGG